ncbi:protein-glutamate O-methyltransferase CheR [Cohnella lubricantis]|uniref:protein-glutamate O-methyltransferase n=1 Tax=Cohnella lubricantis TaxID=2163172 RepID=A0A841T9W8_9BACL|nr:protein-glutamate O-methyltransferase CheR [Cohnella lubricantis]MBB6677752.1 protein-glutamate O-methyltransferase CheR [Cohnella lubricantis]MBP2117714.1 chemotaxis protein methyltransferase CheR [Cohnella lubricantis]
MSDSNAEALRRTPEDEDFLRFVANIRQATSIDLSQYKEVQMRRRLTTLRLKHGFPDFASYFAELMKNPRLLNEFLDRMTINVSEFWRNPNRWQVLMDKFFPEMIKSSPRLQVWSAACSTGEEPYTLAMILDRLGHMDRSSILATDLDEGVLAKAKQGVYLERSLRDVPADFAKAYFKETDGAFAVSDRLKLAVRFQKQNLLLDSFGEGFDLIVCRNVMIYFTEEAKHVLYAKFAKALKPGGILFVGSTEQIFSPGQYGLATADTFFYRRMV